MADVVYVCQTFPWVTQTFTIREVALLREHGLDIEVVSFKRPPEALMDDAARAQLAQTRFVPSAASAAFAGPVLRAVARRPLAALRLAVLALTSHGLLHTTRELRLRNALAVARGLWLAERCPDACHFHAEFPDEAATTAMTAAELAGAGFSFKTHSSFNPLQLARKASRARFVATESEFDRNHYFAELADDRILVNRSGVPPTAEPHDRPPASDELRILSVGTLQEKKGHRFLVGALRLLRERGVPFRCLIVGSGPLEDELRADVRAGGLDDALVIEPYRPHEEIKRLYREYDVFALPCVVTDEGDRDGIPNVLIEAGAAGCALVSTPVSGISELIEDGVSGLLVPERDARALADALARLAAEPALSERLGLGARDTVRGRFDLRRNVGELADRFRRELAASRRGA